VTAVPYVSSIDLPPNSVCATGGTEGGATGGTTPLSETWLVLGTDGLFDVMSAETIRSKLNGTVRSKDHLAKRIVGEALDAYSPDNVCAVVVYFD
jgi:hypothetical protein